MNAKYTFWVKGTYPDGNRGKMSGEVVGPDGYPFSVFEEAVAACLRLTPDLVVNPYILNTPYSVLSYFLFRLTAIAIASILRVSAGSMIPSSQSLAVL